MVFADFVELILKMLKLDSQIISKNELDSKQ